MRVLEPPINVRESWPAGCCCDCGLEVWQSNADRYMHACTHARTHTLPHQSRIIIMLLYYLHGDFHHHSRAAAANAAVVVIVSKRMWHVVRLAGDRQRILARKWGPNRLFFHSQITNGCNRFASNTPLCDPGAHTHTLHTHRIGKHVLYARCTS